MKAEFGAILLYVVEMHALCSKSICAGSIAPKNEKMKNASRANANKLKLVRKRCSQTPLNITWCITWFVWPKLEPQISRRLIVTPRISRTVQPD